MPHCPKCQSKEIRRSRSRSRWERWRKEITGKQPYRCRACNWRGWMRGGLTQEMAGSHSRAMAPHPPNLAGTLLARPDPKLQLDLKELDRFPSRKDDFLDKDDA